MTIRYEWRRIRTIAIPAVILASALGFLVLDSLRLRSTQLREYAIPNDHSARAMLQFMRKLNGSWQSEDSLFESSNLKEVCQAIQEAHGHLDQDRESLSETEQREADFYQLRYSAGAMIRQLTVPTEQAMDQLLSDTREYLATAVCYGTREKQIATETIFLLDCLAMLDHERTFVLWMQAQLAQRPEASTDIASTGAVQELTKALDSALNRLNMIGQKLDIQTHTLDGLAFDSESLRGKVTLLEFWGTHCRPCIDDLPALKRIYASYKDRGFEIVAVCLNTAPARIKKFSAQHQLPWIQLCDDESAAEECNLQLMQRFGIQSVPTAFLIDAEGRVVEMGVRPLTSDHRDLEQRLRQLLY